MRGVERRGAGDSDHLTWTDDQSPPAKPITVDFDTGSESLSNNHGHAIQWGPSSSSTPPDPIGQSSSLPYDGDGATVSGEQHTDTVSNCLV
ncbi:hypothetical protein L210DRAFT_949094 [Boletus edulis BED1]|uniref:Uncharacterized protein n=1 Tax=Boletus edulis BED1 TaxID=1328754 RepID=A0AAD4BAA9_BOLED|nr:hypothetical protein L210DRAFT_949094 [Boletus edulis BED1]